MGKRIRVDGSRNTIYINLAPSKKIHRPEGNVSKGASNVANATTIPVATVLTTPPLATPVINGVPADVSKAAQREKIKNLVSNVIVALGLILLAVGVCVLAAHAIGFVAIDPSQLQTVIMGGFGLIAGGLSLPNTDYKGSFRFGGGALPFSFEFQSQK